MTTLSMKMLDFERAKGPKIVQNGHPGGFKINNFQNNNWKAAAESISRPFGDHLGAQGPGIKLRGARAGGMREAPLRLL